MEEIRNTPETRGEINAIVRALVKQALGKVKKQLKAVNDQNDRLLVIEQQIKDLNEEMKDQKQENKRDFELIRQELKHLREMMGKRFEDMSKRFNFMQWMIGLGFATMAALKLWG